MKNISGNYVVGNSAYFILEACEYVQSFLYFFPKSAIVLNFDNEYLDYFKNIDNIENAFVKYVKLLPYNGLLVTNADDNRCLNLKSSTNAKVITYGINNEDADFIAKNIVFDDNGFPKFDVYKEKEFYSYADLEFGTAGLRGVIGAGINRMNIYVVRKATQGLANYIIKQGKQAQGVAIAYDSRMMSP